MYERSSHWVVALVGLAMASGCGIDELFRQVDKGPPDAVDGGTGEGDGGRGGDGDGDGPGSGDGDGDRRDGGAGPGDGDGDTADGGPVDAGAVESIEDYLPQDCQNDGSDVWSQDVPFGDEGGHAMVPGGTGFGVAYRADDGCDLIHGTFVASTGPLPQGHGLIGADVCTVYRDLALLRDGDRWWLSWVDNLTGSAELHARSLSADMLMAGPIVRVTDNGVAERRPVMADAGMGPLLAWIEGDGERGIMVRALADTNGDSRTIVSPGGDHRPTRLALSAMGGELGAAVAWVNEEGDRGIWVQPLTPEAEAVGSPVELTDFASAGSTVDVAARTRGGDAELGGAAVYSVIVDGESAQVRFRRLDREGQPVEVERTLVGRPLRATDASITELGDGYVVAYRALPDGAEVLSPEIRLLFVTREGSVARNPSGRPVTHRVAGSAMTGGRVSVRASIEGQLLVSWLDFNPNTGQNALKMVRRRLDCR